MSPRCCALRGSCAGPLSGVKVSGCFPAPEAQELLGVPHVPPAQTGGVASLAAHIPAASSGFIALASPAAVVLRRGGVRRTANDSPTHNAGSLQGLMDTIRHM
ncbi:hypothetical protein EYF80_067760 [Liparis tanakae]|uniref:Uncharacterized protein n=1 Tax=Liparis tanakae TaxID=230148 RepID=A0A4Z2E087_9TELE|nr:hypothetical protein EYF80_067760 [Liparis tanakae]